MPHLQWYSVVLPEGPGQKEGPGLNEAVKGAALFAVDDEVGALGAATPSFDEANLLKRDVFFEGTGPGPAGDNEMIVLYR